jgi:hypothetical protein
MNYAIKLYFNLLCFSIPLARLDTIFPFTREITHIKQYNFRIKVGNVFVCLMVFNATFNNISVISWQSVLLVEKTGGPRENHLPVASHWQTYHIMLYTPPWSRFELTTSAVIGTDCIDSCKSNYHTITATSAP